MTDRSWLQGKDDEVRRHLQAQLERVRGQRPRAVLELGAGADAAAARKAFLEASKTFHPTRFARRPDDVRRLASDMFLEIKEAYEDISKGRGRRTSAAPEAPRRSGRIARPSAGSIHGGSEIKKPDSQPAPAAEPAVDAMSLPEFRDASRLCDGGDFAGARAKLQELRQKYPGNAAIRAHLHFAAGAEQLERGRVRRAVQELKRAVAIDPDFEAAKKTLARVAAGRFGGGAAR